MHIFRSVALSLGIIHLQYFPWPCSLSTPPPFPHITNGQDSWNKPIHLYIDLFIHTDNTKLRTRKSPNFPKLAYAFAKKYHAKWDIIIYKHVDYI